MTMKSYEGRARDRRGVMTVNRRIVVAEYGGPEVLRLVEEPMPRPRAGQARVRVIATEVNFTDALLREGVYRAVRSHRSPPATTWSGSSRSWARTRAACRWGSGWPR